MAKVTDVGRYRIVTANHKQSTIKLLVPEGSEIPQGAAHVRFDPAHTQIYQGGWMVGA